MEFKSNQTIASQIADFVKREIFSGRYEPGQKVPPIREFAAFCCVNPNTVVKVYAQLEAERLIYTDSTLGKFVNPDRAAIAAEREKYLMRRTAEFRAELERCGVGRDEFMSLAAGAWSEKGSVEKKCVRETEKGRKRKSCSDVRTW